MVTHFIAKKKINGTCALIFIKQQSVIEVFSVQLLIKIVLKTLTINKISLSLAGQILKKNNQVRSPGLSLPFFFFIVTNKRPIFGKKTLQLQFTHK